MKENLPLCRPSRPVARKRTSQAGGDHAELQSLLHPACTHPAGRQPPPPQAALHPGHEPLHRHRPHTHGDCGGHLQEAGPAPVPGHSQRVSNEVNLDFCQCPLCCVRSVSSMCCIDSPTSRGSHCNLHGLLASLLTDRWRRRSSS